MPSLISVGVTPTSLAVSAPPVAAVPDAPAARVPPAALVACRAAPPDDVVEDSFLLLRQAAIGSSTAPLTASSNARLRVTLLMAYSVMAYSVRLSQRGWYTGARQPAGRIPPSVRGITPSRRRRAGRSRTAPGR